MSGIVDGIVAQGCPSPRRGASGERGLTLPDELRARVEQARSAADGQGVA
ncbi:hypothetical protein [Saccharopolyspora hattusasensis]